MHKLRGSGNTFSTSGQPWTPWKRPRHNILRRARLKKKFPHAFPTTKAKARKLCDAAAAGKLPRSEI